MREAGRTTMEPDEVVAALLVNREHFTSMSSFRKAKNALLFILETRFPHLTEAISALQAESSAGLPKRSAKTSGRKRKEVPTATWRALQSALRRRIANGHKHAAGLLNVLTATLATGLRPHEWCTSRISVDTTSAPGSVREILLIKNSKHSNGRANGTFRAMFIDELGEEDRAAIDAAIVYCRTESVAEADRIQLALKHELEFTRDQIMVSSKQQHSSVTLYSFRHQFIANAKETFADPSIIAALAGHSSTKTAFQHYGKRINNTGKVRVFPTPDSVEAVHKITMEIYKTFVAARGKQHRPSV